MPFSNRITLSGRVVKEEGEEQAYIRQEDIFFSKFTVRETLMNAANFRLPRNTDKRKVVEDIMHKLGLCKCADSVIGSGKSGRGISGGEKKRLRIACELIAAPDVIFADEPTTGLDAYQVKPRTLVRVF